MERFQGRFGELPVFVVGRGVAFQFASGRDSTIARFKLKKGIKTSPTSHSSEQFTYVVEGRLWYTVGNRKAMLNQGDVILVPSGAKHHVQILEDTILLDFFSPAWPDLPRSVRAKKRNRK
jgi:quercetin dioxygenase-like cupin family protein